MMVQNHFFFVETESEDGAMMCVERRVRSSER